MDVDVEAASRQPFILTQSLGVPYRDRPPTVPRAMGITVTSAMASHSLPLLGSWFADDDDLKTPSPLPLLSSAINMTIIGGSVCAARDKLDDVRRCRGRSFVNSDGGGGALRSRVLHINGCMGAVRFVPNILID